MRWLGLLCVVVSAPALAQDAASVGAAAVSTVLRAYVGNPTARVPETNQPLPAGRWGMRGGRPESCPNDSTPCVRVVYAVPEAHVACEWTVASPESGTAAVVLDQNAEASRYFLRNLTAAEVTPLVMTKAEPPFPPIARAAHVSGLVVVRVIVSETGAVTLARAVSGPPILSVSAADAAKRWSFHPLRVGTQAAPFTADLQTQFLLQEDPRNCTKTSKGMACAKLPDGTVTMQP